MEYTDAAYICLQLMASLLIRKVSVPSLLSYEPSIMLEKTIYLNLIRSYLSHSYAVPLLLFCATCYIISSAPRWLAVLILKPPTKVIREGVGKILSIEQRLAVLQRA